ncbi:MAG: putative Flap endonuclease 1-A [Streblomastix strix]|uniref:Flap endonuclease 1 n=1 Tax=Streblomastix strix TaxID=222440 RepID=A0A5J4VUC6_9EUKA|nr:MAG: putative Flap endonuclease 1-A [Streblomastix strix]
MVENADIIKKGGDWNFETNFFVYGTTLLTYIFMMPILYKLFYLLMSNDILFQAKLTNQRLSVMYENFAYPGALVAIKEGQLQNYFSRKIAIDASMALYQFLISIRQDGNDFLTNSKGEITSHLQGTFSRTIKLMEYGIKPLYVFDGKPPEFKGETLTHRKEIRAEAKVKAEEAHEQGDEDAANKFNRRTTTVSKEQNEDVKRLLTLMGVPFVTAESEAEAQCAWLCRNGAVWAVASEDMDTLTFGAPLMLRNLTSSEAKKLPVREINLKAVLEGLELNMDQFIDLCILCGCDYTTNIKKIGEKSALKLIKQHGTLENVLAHIRKTDPEGKKYKIPDVYPIDEIRQLFKHPAINTNIGHNDDKQEQGVILQNKSDAPIQFKWREPDEEGLVAYLVGEKEFNEQRVRSSIQRMRNTTRLSSQSRMDKFFKPKPIEITPKQPSKQSDSESTQNSSKSSLSIKGKGKGSILTPPKTKAKAKAKAKSRAKSAPKYFLKKPDSNDVDSVKEPLSPSTNEDKHYEAQTAQQIADDIDGDNKEEDIDIGSQGNQDINDSDYGQFIDEYSLKQKRKRDEEVNEDINENNDDLLNEIQGKTIEGNQNQSKGEGKKRLRKMSDDDDDDEEEEEE